MCLSVDAEQVIAWKKVEQIEQHAECKKKAWHLQANPGKFTSQVVASKPAALVQQTNKMPPPSTTVIVSGS